MNRIDLAKYRDRWWSLVKRLMNLQFPKHLDYFLSMWCPVSFCSAVWSKCENRFFRCMSGGIYEKHVVATWNFRNHLSICFWAQGNQKNPVSRWPVAGPSEYWLLASSPAAKVKTAIHTLYCTANTHKMTTIHTRQLQQYTQDNYNNTHNTTNNNTHKTFKIVSRRSV